MADKPFTVEVSILPLYDSVLSDIIEDNTTSPLLLTESALPFEFVVGEDEDIPKRKPDTKPVEDAIFKALPGDVVPIPTLPLSRILSIVEYPPPFLSKLNLRADVG